MKATKATYDHSTLVGGYRCHVCTNGIEVLASHNVLCSWDVVDYLHTYFPFRRSRLSMAIEWALHSLCYRVGFQRERAKDVFLEYGTEWFINLFKKG